MFFSFTKALTCSLPVAIKTIKILSVSFPACNVFRKRSRTMWSGRQLRLVMRLMRETAESMVRLRRVGGALGGSDICMTTLVSCDSPLIPPEPDPSRVPVALNRFRSRRSPALRINALNIRRLLSFLALNTQYIPRRFQLPAFWILYRY